MVPNLDALSVVDLRIIKAKTTKRTLHALRGDEKQVREWAIPGTPGLEHRLGGQKSAHNR